MTGATADGPPPQVGRRRGAGAALVAACVGASWLVWLPSTFAGFTGDDLEGVLRATRGDRAVAGLDYAVRQLRPLSDASLWLDRRLWGLDASGFHLTNVVLHGLATALVVVLAAVLWDEAVVRRGLDAGVPRRAAPAVAGTLFLVAPSHSEAVAWVGGRGDLLVAVAALGCLLCWWQAGSSHRDDGPGPAAAPGRAQWWRTAAVVALAAALAAKETAATWALVVAVVSAGRAWGRLDDGTGGPAERREAALRAGLGTWPLAATTGVWFAARWAVLGRPFGSYGSATLLEGAPVGPLRRGASVLVRTFLPGLPPAGWAVATVAVVAVAVAVVAVDRSPGGRAVVRAWPVPALAVGVVVAALPVAGLGVAASGALGERLGYLPSTLGAVLVAWAAAAVVQRWPAAGWAATSLAGAAALVLCVVVQGRWVAAGDEAARLFASAAALPRDRPALVLAQPDVRRGAYVARNALPAALALYEGWTDLTTVWTASTFGHGGAGGTTVTAGPGPRTWTVRLDDPGARFLEVFPRDAGDGGPTVEVRRRGPREVQVRLGPTPPGAVGPTVWVVDDGRLRRQN